MVASWGIAGDDFFFIKARESATEEIHANHQHRSQETQTVDARFHQET
jgi:hypothetical protein